MNGIIQKFGFKLRFCYLNKFVSFFRKIWYSFFGMTIGSGTYLPRIYITWPHEVSIGKDCKLEHGIYFKYDGIWQIGKNIQIGNRVFIGRQCEFNIRKGISIGNDSLIASGCIFVDHDHGISPKQIMRIQQGPEAEIIIGEDVWLGCNVVVLKGVKIGNGAIVAAGAIVTKSIQPYEIWAGIPAKKIGIRFENTTT